MIYPNITDYDAVVGHLDAFVLAPQFSECIPIPRRSEDGKNLLVYPGGYSVVYPIECNGRTLALRCWTKNPGNAQDRYPLTSSYLQSNPLPYFVDFGYVEEGLLVNDSIMPICYMDWVEGLTLCKFLDIHVKNSTAIRDLAEK